MAWLEGIRGLVRPLVTFALTGVVCYLALQGKIDTKELLLLYGPILGFYFGQRQHPGQPP